MWYPYKLIINICLYIKSYQYSENLEKSLYGGGKAENQYRVSEFRLTFSSNQLMSFYSKSLQYFLKLRVNVLITVFLSFCGKITAEFEQCPVSTDFFFPVFFTWAIFKPPYCCFTLPVSIYPQAFLKSHSPLIHSSSSLFATLHSPTYSLTPSPQAQSPSFSLSLSPCLFVSRPVWAAVSGPGSATVSQVLLWLLSPTYLADPLHTHQATKPYHQCCLFISSPFSIACFQGLSSVCLSL